MQTIRTFIAIPLTKAIEKPAIRLITRLQSPDDAIKWVPTDNLHLTLKFLGDVDNVELPKICDTIRRVCRSTEPFTLEFGGTGGFPETQRPRVLYCGIQGETKTLCELVSSLEKQLADLGFKQEPRDYRPHLTLGRTRSSSRRANDDVVARLHAENDVDLGAMRVESVQVIASFLDKSGPTYNVIDTIDLGDDT